MFRMLVRKFVHLFIHADAYTQAKLTFSMPVKKFRRVFKQIFLYFREIRLFFILCKMETISI